MKKSTMSSEPLPKKTKLSSDQSKTNPKSSNPKKRKDLSFILKQVPVLKNIIEALSETKFNPNQEAVIQANENGCEIVVYKEIDPETEGEVFGVFKLNVEDLEEYQCMKSFRKRFSLVGVVKLLRAAVNKSNEPVSVFVEHGSNLLSFKWSSLPSGFGHGCPININLSNATPEYGEFPEVTYGLEAVIPLTSLKTAIAEVLKPSEDPPTEDVLVDLKPESLKIKLKYPDDEFLAEVESEVDEIWVNWAHWKSLERASEVADKCLVYLVTMPPKGVMVRLILGDLSEMVYLNQIDSLSDIVQKLPCLGHF